jgi:hypothetical protein
MRSDLIDITVSVIVETEKAWLVTDTIPEKGVWVPKSQAEIEPAATGGLHTLTLPEWLAIEKGLF